MVADLREIMGDDIDLSEEMAEGWHSTCPFDFLYDEEKWLAKGFCIYGIYRQGI